MTTERYIVDQIAQKIIVPTFNLKCAREYDPKYSAELVTIFVKGITTAGKRVSYPASWWQAFKARWFPIWLKRIFPVSYVSENTLNFCPHQEIHDVKVHVEFLDDNEVLQ